MEPLSVNTPPTNGGQAPVQRGQLSLAAFHNKRQPSDAALITYIEKVGPDRVLAALDKYTEPQLPLFAAE